MVLALLMTTIMTGCSGSETLKDGYYTAIAQEFSHGWKEFVSITVKNNTIVSVEYNAENESGFIKSWDNAYMQVMKSSQGTYPNEYTRNYAAQLLESQASSDIDVLAGASTSYSSFKMLAEAAMQQAKKGDSRIAIVDTEA